MSHPVHTPRHAGRPGTLAALAVLLTAFALCFPLRASADADLSLTKIGTPNPVVAGEALLYTISVTNNGPNDASNVVVTDTLPSGVQLASSNYPCVASPNTPGALDCMLGSLAPGAVAALEIGVQTGPDLPDVIINIASVTSDTADPNPQNNATEANVAVVPKTADLALTKIGTPNPVVAGEIVNYTLTLVNNGPHDAPGVFVADDLAGLQAASFDPECAVVPDGSLLCLPGALAAGAIRQIGYSVHTPADYDGALTNTAEIGTLDNVFDNNLANNTAVATVQVGPPPTPTADLGIEKTALQASVIAGSLVTYELKVTNNGPDAALGVFVTDDLPAGLQFVGSDGDCSVIGDGSLLCELGTLAAGVLAQPIMITLQTPATLQGQLANTAAVGSATLDINLDNNTSTAIVQVEPSGVEQSTDLALTKTASASQIMPGDTFDYILTVSNQGPNSVGDILLFDPLPQGLQFMHANTACSGVTNIVCTPGTLEVGAAITVVMTVQASNNITGELQNTASVSSESTADPLPANNMASVIVVVAEDPAPPSRPLSLLPTDTLLPSALVGEPFTLFFSGRGGQAPLLLSGANAPPGLDFFTAGDGAAPGSEIELRGVPTQAGDFVITVTLTDSAAPPTTIVRDYRLSIGTALDIRPLSLPVTQVGANFITSFMTANGIPPESFTSSDPLPPGFQLNANSLTGVATQIGDFSFTIQAVDAAGNQGARDYTLSVLPAGLLILTDALPDGIVGASYGAQVLAIGGVKPYSWRLDSAAPDGLVFSNTGFFNGIPTAAGSFVVTVTVQDQAGAVASADLPLTINRTGLVNLTPEILPNGLLGVPYRVSILPDGGKPPYKAVLIEGQAPPGLKLSKSRDAIRGIPRKPGVYRFEIMLWDKSKPPLRKRTEHVLRILE